MSLHPYDSGGSRHEQGISVLPLTPSRSGHGSGQDLTSNSRRIELWSTRARIGPAGEIT
jgi:hypothetical protein